MAKPQHQPLAHLTLDPKDLIEAGRYDEAVAMLRAAAQIADSAADEIEAAFAWNALGVACKFAGRYDEAAAAYTRALPVAEEVVDDDPELLCCLLHNLGGLAHSRGQYADAEPFARRGLELRERFFIHEDVGIAADAAALAAILEGLERWDDAEHLYRRALAIWEADGDAYEIAMSLNGLAAVRRFAGHPGDAEVLFRRALTMLEQAREPGHPSTSTVRNNLAMLLNAIGRAADALPLLDRAAADLAAALGDDHPATRDIARNRDRIAAVVASGGTRWVPDG